LIPIKRKQLIEQLSLSTGLNEQLLDDLVVLYYKEVSSELVRAENVNINVHKLGVFYIKPWSLETTINRMKKMKNAMKKPRSLQAYAIHKEKIEHIELLERLQEKVEAIQQQKVEVKLKRQQYEQESKDHIPS